MTVRDLMNSNLVTIRPEATALVAAQKMRDSDIGVLPVVDGDNVIGMLTDRDLTIRVLAEGLEPGQVEVEDIMTPDLLSCRADDSIETAAELMAERQVQRLLVMDENNKPLGILSIGDLALRDEESLQQALGGIKEKRHDEPGAEMNH